MLSTLVYKCLFESLLSILIEYTPRSRIAGRCGNSMFNFFEEQPYCSDLFLSVILNHCSDMICFIVLHDNAAAMSRIDWEE